MTSSGLRVTVAGLDFHGYTDRGFAIGPEGFEGWDDGVEVRRSATARPGNHGAFDDPGYLEARVVSLTGTCIATSQRELQNFKHRFTGLLAGGQMGRIQVQRPGEVLWADCRLAAKPVFQQRGGLNHASYQIQFWCPIPLKYGESHEFSGPSFQEVKLWHRGNFDAFPEVTITATGSGMPNGFTLNGPNGETYQLTRNIPAGDSFRLNMAEGFVRFSGGTPVIGGYGRMDTWTVPPGGESSIRLGGTGTGSISATVRDTYI